MPKPAYRLILGVFLLTFIVASCDNKSKKEKETTTDSITTKPVDPGTAPSTPDTMKTDSVTKKPVDPGT